MSVYKWLQSPNLSDTYSICAFPNNVPVVFMARYVMVLMRATSLRGAMEGVGPENRDFFGPKKVEINIHTLIVICHKNTF